MKEVKANIFDLINQSNVNSICIATNGIIGAAGLAVMESGTAGEAAKRWPNIRFVLGKQMLRAGNVPMLIGFLDAEGKYTEPNYQDFKKKNYKCLVWSFPTKNDFRKPSEIDLIKCSAETIVQRADKLKLKNIYIPRPGCANDDLDWNDVKPILENVLDDRFTITSLENEE